MSHPASGWQKSPLLEWCYNVFFVCVCGREGEEEREQQRQPTGFSVPWHVLVGRGVHLLMKCVGRFIQVHFRRQATCVVPDVCVYLSLAPAICVQCLNESMLHIEKGERGQHVDNTFTYCQLYHTKSY